MLNAGTYSSEQQILAYFTRPNRSINHARIIEIRGGKKHSSVPAATAVELERFIKTWPMIDPKTGLHLLGDELLVKAREAMLSAVQGYNDPKTYFKSELFIVTAVIAWTYLLHYYYQRQRVDHRYCDANGEPKQTRHGAVKLWDLERCMKAK